jgi:hypothetical protein
MPHFSVRGDSFSYDVAMGWWGKGKKKKEAQKRKNQAVDRVESERLQPAGNGGPAADDAALARRTPYDRKAAGKMRRELQKALGRPVILPDERPLTRATRAVVKRRGVLIGLGVLGVSIASVVVTGGAAAVGLGIAAASLPAVNIPRSSAPGHSTRTSA